MQEQVLSQNANEGGKGFGLPLTFFSEDTDEKKASPKNNKNLKDWEKAEKLFEEHLNKIEIPFFRVDQKPSTKCDVFKKKNICRPDYIIQTKNDYFYIDVKQRSNINYDKNNYKRFTIDQKNILRLFHFQEEFHQKVWLAYIDNLQNTDFYFVSISKVFEYFSNIITIILRDKYFDHFHEIHNTLVSNKIKHKLWIYIPEILFFNKLSFDKGFYKISDKDFYKDEADFHKSKWETTIDNMILKFIK